MLKAYEPISSLRLFYTITLARYLVHISYLDKKHKNYLDKNHYNYITNLYV